MALIEVTDQSPYFQAFSLSNSVYQMLWELGNRFQLPASPAFGGPRRDQNFLVLFFMFQNLVHPDYKDFPVLGNSRELSRREIVAEIGR